MSPYEEFKVRLEAELKILTDELSAIAVKDPVADDWVAVPEASELGEADENVVADAVEDWDERRALVAQLETRYRNVMRALNKIAAGTYGVCEISGEQIEIERLRANPAARTNQANMDRERELVL